MTALRARAKAVWELAADWLLAAGCFLFSLILYLQTMAPSVAALYDDSLEFPLVVHRLAIAHPTGYPLYTLLARLVSRGPWTNVAWGVNLLSALAAALTVALVYLVARRLVRPAKLRRLPALVGALALAVSPVFWSQAVVAEVYALHAAFVAGLLWLALHWARRPLVAVRPFSLLLAPPARRGPLFLPRPGLWTRLPVGVRRFGRRAGAAYRRALPAVPPARRLQPPPLLYALAGAFGLALAMMFLLGAANPITNGPLQAVMQANVAPEMQGRVFTLLNSLSSAASPIGLAVAGPVADLLGVRAWFLMGGVACTLLAITGLLMPAVVHVEDQAVVAEGQGKAQPATELDLDSEQGP